MKSQTCKYNKKIRFNCNHKCDKWEDCLRWNIKQGYKKYFPEQKNEQLKLF